MCAGCAARSQALTAQIPSGSASAPNNPTYIQLQTQLNAADIAIRDLTSRRYDLSSQIGCLAGRDLRIANLRKAVRRPRP